MSGRAQQHVSLSLILYFVTFVLFSSKKFVATAEALCYFFFFLLSLGLLLGFLFVGWFLSLRVNPTV
jgi:hypothetical protein